MLGVVLNHGITSVFRAGSVPDSSRMTHTEATVASQRLPVTARTRVKSQFFTFPQFLPAFGLHSASSSQVISTPCIIEFGNLPFVKLSSPIFFSLFYKICQADESMAIALCPLLAFLKHGLPSPGWPGTH